MADVVGLDGKPKVVEHGLAPVASIVAKLEELLAEAKRGDVRAFGMAVVRAGNTTSTIFDTSDEPISHELMAGITYLQHRYAAHKIETSIVTAKSE